MIGAPEFIFSSIPEKFQREMEPYMAQGHRVLALASYPDVLAGTFEREPQWLATLIISDNLRENAQETLAI